MFTCRPPTTRRVRAGRRPSPSPGVPPPPPRDQCLSIHPIDPAVLAPYFDATTAMSAQVEQHATDLFYGLLTYVGDAPGVESVVLPRRLWKEAVCEGDGGAPQPSVDNRAERTEAAGEPPAAFARRADRPAYAVRYHAGTGVHRVEWDGRTVWVVVAVAQRPTGYSMPEYLRSVIVYMPKFTATDGGVCDSGGVKTTTRTLLTAFIRNVVEWNALRVDQLSHTHYKMYRYSTECRGNNRWVEEGLHPSRSLESVIMPPKIREDLVKDAQAFLEPGAREWYTAKGVPYRRCYFLHGPPGTGKSSFVRALAGKLRLPVAFLQAASTGMSDSLLADAFRDVPRNGVLVLEGTDAGGGSRGCCTSRPRPAAGRAVPCGRGGTCVCVPVWRGRLPPVAAY